jgi:ribosomal protein S18 acetylase RimI-like enzyme
VIVLDWSALPDADMAVLYNAESARWLRDWSWDAAGLWAVVETARTTWGLPGLLCIDMDGRIRGWAFYMAAELRIDVGGLVADSPEATAALVDELVARAGSSRCLNGLIGAAAPDLLSVLAARAVAYGRYSYQMRDLEAQRHAVQLPSPQERPHWTLRDWSPADLAATATLLHEAYAGRSGPVGADATLHGWRSYVTNVVHHQGCGTLSPALSRVLTIQGTVAAVSLVSTIAPATAHLVQLAVARSHQGSGIGRAMLGVAVDAARDAGCTALSLLVSDDNVRACRLYRQSGFVERGTFVAIGADREPVMPAAQIA